MKKIFVICSFFEASTLGILIFSFIFFILPSKSQAATNFTTSYNTTYSVNPTGSTHVLFAVTLKNTTSDYYASSYSLHVGFKNATNFQASDPTGIITPDVNNDANGYKVGLIFNKRVVGLNNALTFTLSFDTSDVAQKTGNIWEINIPGVANQENFDDFTVHVNVPPSFGVPTYIKPTQGTNVLDFTKGQLQKSGISITFGDHQIYDFTTTYHLSNKNLFPVTTDIALPPSTNYQDVYITNLNPKPVNVVRDKDGNWLATYYLAPAQKEDVIAVGKAYLSLQPKEQPMSSTDLKVYFAAQPYWETKNNTLQQLAQTYRTPEQIYDYVRNTLTYDFSRVKQDQQRLGAVGVLANPKSAVCLEFTDLFIAMARAAGIPAREIDGYAYTQNDTQRPLSLVKDVLHAWPEYYDTESQRWIMVDPTWGNTTGGVDYFHTLDFDHFAFVVKGISSEYPVPAGGYKLPGQEDFKDVAVSFGADTAAQQPQMDTNYDFAPYALPFFPITGTVTVTNIGQAIIPQQEITITSDLLQPAGQKITTQAIPPFGHIAIPIEFTQGHFLTNRQAKIRIQVAQKNFSIPIMLYSLFGKESIIIFGGIILASCSLIILIIAIRTRRVSVLK